MNGKFIAYYRVSTQKQGQSGLGLEAQRNDVVSYLNGGDWKLLGEFVEVESGKKSNRPQLAAALADCKKHKATLIIAKLDRLSRDASFLMALRDSGQEIRAVDMPNAGTLEFGMRAVFAQHEREETSRRTKAALAAAKARGVVLGKNGRKNGWKLAEANSKAATERARNLTRTLWEIRNDGHTTIREIAAELNRREIPTARGGKWRENTVHRLLSRLEELAAA
jgi:DNA invertase Pin-like site-specific DNA recombinase